MKKMTTPFLKTALVLVALAFSSFSFCSDYFWVNGSGNWNDPLHWSLTSGGPSCASIPTLTDDVFFDVNSFSTNFSEVSVNQNISVKDIHFESPEMFTLSGINNELTISGELTATSKFNLNLKTLIFNNTTTSAQTINTFNSDIGADIKFLAGNWNLAGHLQTIAFKTLNFDGGQFHSNGFSVAAEYIYANTNLVHLDFTNSTVVAMNDLDLSQSVNIGGAASFITLENDVNPNSKGGFTNSNSTFDRDQTVVCTFAGNPTGLSVDIVSIDFIGGFNVSCDGVCDGQITITPSGTAGPYSYSVNGGGLTTGFTSQNVYSSLCQANYVISVKDSSQEINPPSGVFVNCNTTELINPPAPLFLDELGPPTVVSCFGLCDANGFTDPIGGAGPYTVTWATSGEVTPFPNFLCAGVNPVQIVDANGCILDTSLVVTGPDRIVGTITLTEPTCFGDCDGELLVAYTGGNGSPYSLNWNPIPTSGQLSNPGVGFCAGPVTISMFDKDGCQQDTTITMTQPAILNATPLNIDDASCFGLCDGEAASNPTGGAGGNTFEWFTCAGVSTGITDENPTNLCAGDYYVIVTDLGGLGCSFQSACITISQPPEIDATAEAYGVSCFGVCDGSVDVDVTGGAIPYGFSWVTIPGGIGIGASDSISGLCPGFYEIIVTDNQLCNSIADTVEVTEPLPLTLSITGTNPSCYDLCDGSAIASPNGGTLPYNLNWIPNPGAGQGTSTVSSMCVGTYNLTLTDSNNCSITEQIILTPPPLYDITTTKSDLECAGDNDGTIDITVNNGGTGTGYTYLWTPNPPIGNGTPNVSGLTAGTWCVTIQDPLLCDTTICIDIDEPQPLTANASFISHVSCHGDCNGSAQVVIGGGTLSYNILWSPSGQNTAVANNLCAGNHTVTITDGNLCTVNDQVTINEPAPFDISVSQTDIDCFGDCGGVATVTINGGGSPLYNYIWTDPLAQNTPSAIGLCAGPLTVTISDQQLCDTVIPFNIIQPNEIIIDTNVINSACFGSCSGEAYITFSGGTGPNFTFEWFDVVTGLPLGVNNDSINGLCPGQYYAQITDNALCVVLSDTITITELPQINTSVISTGPATCGICDGNAEVLATGGSANFTYTWTPSPGTGQGTAITTGLCAGVYNVVATDQAGCSENISVNINSVALETTSMDSTDITCFGFCDGTATLNYTFLDPPYTVTWFDNLTGLPIGIVDSPASEPSVATGLCAGEYLAVLTNGSNCVTSDTIQVIEPEEITGTVTPSDVSCNGACDGSASVTALGGTGTLSYTWGTALPGAGQGTPNASGLCAGGWTVTITDNQGCNTVIPTTIAEPVLLEITTETSTNISCVGDTDGTATIIHNGGLPLYSYQWIDCNTGLPIGQNSQIANNLPAGDYQVIVTDSENCTVTSSCLPVIEPLPLNSTLNIDPVNCFGYCDGLIDIVISGGTAPYFYQWQDQSFNDLTGQTDDTLSNVCQGIYNILVTDFKNCPLTFGPIDMTAPNSTWNITTSQTAISCTGNNDATATVAVLGGNNPPYTYSWNDPLLQNTPTATNLPPGTWTVTVSDASICDTTVTFTIVDPNPIFANASITNVLCFGDCTGSITTTPSGGTGTYTITWSDLQTGITASNLCVGPITATITDQSGCFIDTTIIITEPTELTSASSFFNNSTCGICNGSATINMTGGEIPYTYDWTPNPAGGDGNNVATGLCPGVISVVVTDDNLCTYTEVFPISDINAEILTMDSTDVSCFGLCDGIADVTYTCSDPGCTNQWYDGTTGLQITGETGTTLSGQCAGNYFVEVTNASGCIAIGSTTISGPSQIVANEVITQITCNGASDGLIDLSPSGGSGAGYTYVWTPIPPNGQGNNQASSLGGGIWCVDITDNSNCVQNYCYNIIDPLPIIVVPTVTEPSCNGDCNGIISVNVSGGYGNYSFQWFDGSGAPIGTNSNLISGLCQDNYTVQITDIGGCIQSFGITLSEPSAISAPITSTDALCFGDCNGTATVTPSGGFPSTVLPAYTVNWFDSSTGLLIGQTGNTATNICTGDYHAVITDLNGCSFQSTTINIGEPGELTWTINQNDASCFGICDGNATITPLGGTTPYAYNWLDITATPIVGGTNQGVVNLCAGNYTVELTDTNGCTSGPQAVIIQGFPEITANVFSNDATCGLADGNATVFALGGNPTYFYQWYDNLLNPLAGETANVLLNVAAGTYFVDVTDLNGCTEQFQANISNFSSTTFNWDNVNHPSCFGFTDGSLEITATTISPPLTYLWNPGGLIAEDPTGLAAGNWLLQITDGLGCINFYDTTLVDPNEIIVTPTTTPSDCDQCNGAITVAVSGGSGPLNVIWNTGQAGNTITNLCPSIYEAQVTDPSGCQVNQTIDIPNNSGLSENVIIQAITCAGSCDGEASINGIGGTTPYTYLWLHDNSTSQTQTGLCAGSYFCEITDGAGCIKSVVITMSDPTSIDATTLITTPSCNNNDGSITVTSSGGILPHTYLWNTLSTNPVISGIGAGIYTLTISDNAGCSEDFIYGLNNTDAPVAIVTGTDLNCNNICDGSADTLSVIGTGFYTFDWLDDTGVSTTILFPQINNLCAGDYILETTDNLGCISYSPLTLNEPDTITLNPLNSIAATCAGICDGQLISNPIGGTLPFTFLWDDPLTQNTITANGLCSGTYTIVVTDNNGCTSNQTGTVDEPTPIIVVTDSINGASCQNAADGEIYISVSGGTPTYNTQWISQTLNDTINVEDPTGLLPMNYYLSITDNNGCMYMDTLTVDTSITVLANAGIDTLLCADFGTTLIATSNVDPNANYTWYDQSSTTALSDTNDLILSPNTEGSVSYIVEVSYSGCTHTDTVIVSTSASLEVDAGPNIEMFSQQTSLIGGSPTSNDATTTYSWTPSIFLDDPNLSNPNVIQPTTSDWYFITITDTNGCTAIDSMYVTLNPDISIPDGISPDGNGLNDTWILDFIDLYPDVSIDINVYNRWGEPLFNADETYADDWGGTTKTGDRLPAGTYYYTITVEHEDFPDPFTGPITIMW